MMSRILKIGVGQLVMLSLVSVSLALGKKPEKCDVCDIFKTGIADTKPVLESILEKLPKAPECRAEVTVLTGPESGPNEGSQSRVECPRGTTLVNCRCDAENMECEGVVSFERKCTAFKGQNTPGRIQAVATCVPTCVGDFTIERFPLIGFRTGRPVATCPANSEIAGCWMYSRASLNPYAYATIDTDTRSCMPAMDCNNGVGCYVQALCKAV